MSKFLAYMTEVGSKDIVNFSLQIDSNAPAVNNHVCPTCGNNRVSKPPAEITCWKCGGKL